MEPKERKGGFFSGSTKNDKGVRHKKEVKGSKSSIRGGERTT